MAEESSLKRSIRFDLNNSPISAPSDFNTHVTKETSKKTVKSGTNDEIILMIPVIDSTNAEAQHTSPLGTVATVVDTTASPTSLPPPPPNSNLSTTSSFFPISNQPNSSAICPDDIQSWTETVSSSTAPSPSSSHGSGLQPPSCPSIKSFYMDPDPGEKDADGNVKQATKEPCDECGGQVVWATRREYYLICARCQQPQ